MKITSNKEISQADYNSLINGTREKLEEFVGWAARFSPYHPAGYGCWNERVYAEGTRYFCAWDHSDNCD